MRRLTNIDTLGAYGGDITLGKDITAQRMRFSRQVLMPHRPRAIPR